MAPAIVLTGFMGCGKTTVGLELARNLSWGFVDLDEVVTAASGMEIPAIFASEGEKGFRAREINALRELMKNAKEASVGMVVALGGGTLVQSVAADLVKGKATVVYLDIEAKEAWQRVSGSDRPLASGPEQFAHLLESRRHIYENIADITISVGSFDSKKVVQQILDFIKKENGLKDV